MSETKCKRCGEANYSLVECPVCGYSPLKERNFDARYLAGLFDGHGSVSCDFDFDNKGRRTRFQVAMTLSSELDFVETVRDMIQDIGIKCKVYIIREKEGCAAEKQVFITNRVDAIRFLKKILPHIILTRHKVIDALEAVRDYYESFKSKTRPKTQNQILKITEGLVGKTGGVM